MNNFSLALINSTLPIRMYKLVIKVLSFNAHQFSIALKEKKDQFFKYNCVNIQVKLVRRQHLAVESKNSVNLKIVAFLQVEPQ